MRRLMLAALLASAAMPALADDDSHIAQVAYKATNRVQIIGVVGHPTTITFPKGESVYRIVQSEAPVDGDDNAPWHSAQDDKDHPFGNNLPLWPTRPGASTMTVITVGPDGTQKPYPFAMTALADTQGSVAMKSVVFNLMFTGQSAQSVTAEQASGSKARRIPKRSAEDAESASEHLRTDAFNGADGVCHYHAQGKQPSVIEPRCPMDNGEWTLMRFPGLSSKPAVYILSGDKDERLARQHGAGDLVVVEEIAAKFRLRLGAAVLDIVNDAYDPAGKPTATGTTTPTVMRDIIRIRAQ